MRADILAQFDLDPAYVHLNHGAYGAAPRVVREEMTRWRDRAEVNPMHFHRVELFGQLAAARAEMTDFLRCSPGSTAFVRNVTEAMAVVSRMLIGSPGTRPAGANVVVSSHGYPTLGETARVAGAEVRTAYSRLAAPDDEIVASFVNAVDEHTALVVVDHVTSPTATVFPVRDIARAVAPIPVLVDAAHSAGSFGVLDIEDLGVAFWSTNLHKWAMCARPAGALWVAERYRAQTEPLVTSWTHDGGYPRSFDYPATGDYAPWLAIPRGLRFWHELGGVDHVRAQTALIEEGADIVAEALGGSPVSLPAGQAAPTMRLVPLPAGVLSEAAEIDGLYEKLHVAGFEVAPVLYDGAGFLRIGAQAYNNLADYRALAGAVRDLLG